jgi:antitoxin VapB
MMLDSAVVDIVVTTDRVYAVTDRIEAERLISEELPPDMPVEVVEWWKLRPTRQPQDGLAGSDVPLTGEIDLSLEIEQARQQLTEEEIGRYQETAKTAVLALEEALPMATPEMTEMDIAQAIASALWGHGLEPVVLLVAGDRRRKLHRHPLPTYEPIGDMFYASICARGKGLVTSATRVVSFKAVPPVDRAAYETLLEVEAAFFNETKPGAVLGRIFTSATARYQSAKSPLASDEWHKHHQGGPTGYLARDWLVKPETQSVVMVNQAFAWNPSGGGVKVEDTMLATSEGTYVLAEPVNWPTAIVASRKRPDILIL